MSFVEVVFLDWKQTRKHHGECVVKQQPVKAAESKASHSHNTSRKGNSTSVGDTLVEEEGGEEALTTVSCSMMRIGLKCLLKAEISPNHQVMPKKALSV